MRAPGRTSRRTASALTLFFLLSLALSLPLAAAAPKDIVLPKRPSSAGQDLVTALEKRKTTREYAAGRLSEQDLSALLWAANGVNRPYEFRTAPSAFGNSYIDVYVVADGGTYLYDAPGHRLMFLSAMNDRARLSGQRHVGGASHVLVLVADRDRLPTVAADGETLMRWAHVTAGAVAQNVYLMAAARGIGTCLVGGIKEPEVRSALGLPQSRVPLYVMPLGNLKK